MTVEAPADMIQVNQQFSPKLSELQQELNIIGTDVDTLKTGMAGLQVRMDRLEFRMDRLETKVDLILEKLPPTPPRSSSKRTRKPTSPTECGPLSSAKSA